MSSRSSIFATLLALLLHSACSDSPHAHLEFVADANADATADGTAPPWDIQPLPDGAWPDVQWPELPSGEDLPVCQPNCTGRECGDDGCGGSCGQCDASEECVAGTCGRTCDSPACALGLTCRFADGTPALCGGTVTFNVSPSGQPLAENVDVSELFGECGVLFSTPAANSLVTTNFWELASPSAGNSCATLDNYGNPWLSPVVTRFVVPGKEGSFQAGTHYVKLYVGNTWPGGLAVDFYGPSAPPFVGTNAPFHTIMSDGEGTDIVEYGSGEPIGYLVVHSADDPDFTMDDLTFGPIYVP